MTVKLKTTKDYDIKYLQVSAGVRYYEDGCIDGVDDNNDNPKMPCINNGYWEILVDVEAGKIVGWESFGITAKVHYKVCDDGIYKLLDANKETIVSVNDYVPKMLDTSREGYGDYIILEIDKEGKIKDFKADFDYFQDRK